tara:strand:+ start:746 stop:1339 length:594 start_codon:yes stop_codon:yes gene_type:complete
MEAYNWSKMSGKLEGIPALNTDTTTNKFCQAMSKKEDTICAQCYSWSMLTTFRKNAVPRFKKNSDYISKKVHDKEYLPKVKSVVARFNGHGELINSNHFHNIITICENQPKTTFTLWTKKHELVNSVLKKRKKPSNLLLVYSNEYIDTIAKLPKNFDKTFNNVSFDSDKINCHRACIDCMMCYDVNDKTTTIVEKVK